MFLQKPFVYSDWGYNLICCKQLRWADIFSKSSNCWNWRSSYNKRY